MLRHIDSKNMGRSMIGWLDSHFHFSFAEYYNPKNINFGVLRVINDDMVQPGTGFDMHSHKNMEILSYVIDGRLTHADSMSNQETLTRGQAQYMSAGTGVVHSEHNLGDSLLRFLQIWIIPDAAGHRPNYGDYRFEMADRENRWMPIATKYGNKECEAPVSMHADVNIYATMLTGGKAIEFKAGKGRQAYMVMIEGAANVNGLSMNMRDGLEIVEEDVTITPKDSAHILVIEMAKA